MTEIRMNMQGYYGTHFAPVAPIQILEEMLDRDVNLFGNYHLLLAHHTVEQSERFEKLWRRYNNHKDAIYHNPLVIMDNSIVELGESVVTEMVASSCQIVRDGCSRANIIPVLPDVMGDGAATIEAVRGVYAEWESNDLLGSEYMLVTQGKDWVDFMNTVNYFFIEHATDYKRIQWVGIPRKLLAGGVSRVHAVRYIRAIAPHVKIHLLGFSDMIWDDIDAAQFGVVGIDSAVPVRYEGILTPTSKTGPRGDWWETGKLTYDAIRNIKNVRNWVG